MLARIARYGHAGFSGRAGLGAGVLRVPLLREMSPAAIVLGST